MLREMDFVEGDWAALFWALGCATAVLVLMEGGSLLWLARAG
jgi:hypothetical protein